MAKITQNKFSGALKKRLGQNFLQQAGIIDKMIAAAKISAGELILEIGPGTGNLTEKLTAAGNPVAAIEKDRQMIDFLRQKFAGAKNFSLIGGDALGYNESAINIPYKIIANLPFYAAAPIIRKFLESKNPPKAMSLIVQKEVARRICARAPKMNLLALATQFYATPKIIGNVSKGSFWPAPKVDAAILLLTPLPREGERGDKKFIEKFFTIARAGFSHPRKILAGNLAQELKLPRQKIVDALKKSGIAPDCRAQTLPPEKWIELTRTFAL